MRLTGLLSFLEVLGENRFLLPFPASGGHTYFLTGGSLSPSSKPALMGKVLSTSQPSDTLAIVSSLSLTGARKNSQHLRMHVILLGSPGYLGWSPIWKSLILFTYAKSLAKLDNISLVQGWEWGQILVGVGNVLPIKYMKLKIVEGLYPLMLSLKMVKGNY